MVDSWRKSKEAVTQIGAYMEPSAGETELRRAYAILKRWYRHASACAPNPSRTDTEKVRGYFHTLYQSKEPQLPGIPLATHVDPVQVNDKTPLKAEVEAAIFRLRPFKAGRHTHLHAEHLKQWMR